MRIIFKTLLGVAIVFMAYLCYSSIMTPIRFEAEKAVRDEAVKRRLIDIRKAQIEFLNLNQRYTGSFDTLIYFVKTAKSPIVLKKGELTDAQMEKGLTEEKALTLTPEEAPQYGIENYEEFRASFVRDTSYVSVLESAFGRNFPIDSIRYVPFTDKAQFEMEATSKPSASGIQIPLFEARVPFALYLNGLDKQEIINLIDARKTQEKYEGLKVGDINSPNNNVGNWE
ncbi:MAG: hypothetical protein LBR52_00570 [Prevotellaceae bacterium]|jgi:hypothetical protein|nr:hypothetical protein [Prevotellaceae bacterium]